MAQSARSPAASAAGTESVGLHRRTARHATAPTPEDLEIARADALLQLRIGRSAHYYAILASAALVLDAVLVIFFPPPTSGGALVSGSFTPQNLYFLYPPVLAGAFLAILGLVLKWDEFQLWPWERHFWASVLSVVAALAAGYLLIAGTLGVGPTAAWPIVPYLLPLTLGGISLTMAGFALTWPSFSRQQLASLVAAVLPFPFSFVVLAHLPGGEIVEATALMIFGAGWLYQTSGSFLHLISSGTRAHEREMINSGQTRMFAVADELRRRESSLELREATVLQKETELDDGELSLKRRVQAATEQRAHLDAMEADLRARTEALGSEQTKWASQSAAARAAQTAADDKESDLVLREKQLADRLPGVAEREARVVAKEGEIAGRESELGRACDELARREATAREDGARLDARRADIDRRTAELLPQEARLRSRETMATSQDQDRASLSQRLADVEGREARLQQLEISLKELQSTLQRQGTSTATAAAALAEREERAGKSSSELATREARLSQRELEVESTVRAAESSRLRYEEALRGQEGRGRDLDTRSTELDRRLGQLQERERAALSAAQGNQREAKLAEERGRALDRREKELLERARPSTAATTTSATSAPTEAAPPSAGLVAMSLAPGERRNLPDRQSTGAPRMDDLLLGGLPPKGHVLLLGPAFVGKELLLYQFVAEGLRRGETVVLLSGGRPAAEASEAMRSVVPELADRERKGQVLWVEGLAGSHATAPAAPKPGAPPVGGRSPAELLAGLVQAARKAEANSGHPFRVGVLGLGQLLRGLPEGDAAAFFQNFVGILKPRNALAVYTLDIGVLPEAMLSVVQSRTDGVVEFKEDRGRSFFAVRGLGEVETRDWVEYRTSPTGLVIGSFSLERIR